jgi:dynein heavy chain
MPPNLVLDKLKKLIFEFKDTIPVVVALRNPSLNAVHWQQIKQEIIGKDFDIKSLNFTLQSLIELNFQSYLLKI